MSVYTTQSICTIYFFFQAEDGIRDGHVTGVQTCALPIFGQPGGNRTDILVVQALGDGTHEVLRVIVALVGLPGTQLALDIAGMLTGDTGEDVAGTLVTWAVTALARDNVTIPVAHHGELLTACQQSLIGLAALCRCYRQLGIVSRHIGDLLIIEHIGEGQHGRAVATLLLEVVQLLGDIVGIQPRQTRPGFTPGNVHATTISLVASHTSSRSCFTTCGIPFQRYGLAGSQANAQQ